MLDFLPKKSLTGWLQENRWNDLYHLCLVISWRDSLVLEITVIYWTLIKFWKRLANFTLWSDGMSEHLTSTAWVTVYKVLSVNKYWFYFAKCPTSRLTKSANKPLSGMLSKTTAVVKKGQYFAFRWFWHVTFNLTNDRTCCDGIRNGNFARPWRNKCIHRFQLKQRMFLLRSKRG
mgnify:CR=1 FL=1